MLSERAKTKKLLDLKKTNNELKQLTKQRRLGGERVTALAAMLLLTPDPVTSLASLPMFAVAQMMKSRRKSSDLGRVLDNARSEITGLNSACDLLSSLRV